jgi:hypothetical protein
MRERLPEIGSFLKNKTILTGDGLDPKNNLRVLMKMKP